MEIKMREKERECRNFC